MNHKINGIISNKMEEIQKRLKQKEAIKARELLVLAGGLTHFDALILVKEEIERNINNESSSV